MQSALNKVTTRQMDYQNSNLYEVIGSVNVSNIKINDIILYENLTTMSLYYEWLSKERPEEFDKMIQKEEKRHLTPPEGYNYMEEDVFWDIIERDLKGEESTESLIR